jgi:hypothetical protein
MAGEGKPAKAALFSEFTYRTRAPGEEEGRVEAQAAAEKPALPDVAASDDGIRDDGTKPQASRKPWWRLLVGSCLPLFVACSAWLA